MDDLVDDELDQLKTWHYIVSPKCTCERVRARWREAPPRELRKWKFESGPPRFELVPPPLSAMLNVILGSSKIFRIHSHLYVFSVLDEEGPGRYFNFGVLIWWVLAEMSLRVGANAVKYVFSANTVLILIQYFLGQISVLNLTEFFILIARNWREVSQICRARVPKLVMSAGLLCSGQWRNVTLCRPPPPRWLQFATPIWSRLAALAKVCPSRYHFI